MINITPICPKCRKDFWGHPAISRDDNNTEVCRECELKEALEQVFEIIEKT